MQENEHEWQSNQDEIRGEHEPEQIQVPSSLLSNVLHHLDLSPEQVPPAQSLDNLLLKLQSDTWQERTQALHALGKLGPQAISLDLIAPFLHAEDETVRATTIYILSMLSQEVPLHWLVEALHDKNWHVRENAVFALAKQGARVPIEVLMTALHDRDGSVREAASFVLQQRPNDATVSALYGQLREETSMQREPYDPASSNGKHPNHTPVAAPNGEWNGTFMEYSGNAPRTHVVSEQMQAYASSYHAPHTATTHEVPPDEYAETMGARNEKVTSYRLHKRSNKSWWIATIIITAFLFLGVGRVSTMLLPQSTFDNGLKPINNITIAEPNKNFMLDDPTYAPIMQNALSSALNLPPQRILEQVKQLGSLDAVASRQKVSSSQLYTIEMNAFNEIVNNATKTGRVNPKDGASLIDQLSNDSGLREKTVLVLLSVGA